MGTRIILIRHGDPGYNNKFVGTTDYDLVDGAAEKAKEFGKNLKNEGIVALYSSQLKRAAQTADAIGESLGLKVDERFNEFNEIDFGEWEDKEIDDIRKEQPEEMKKRGDDLWNHNSYNGENFIDVRNRVMPLVMELLQRHEGKTFAIVAHGIVNRVICAVFTGISIKELLMDWEIGFLATLFFKKNGDKIDLEKTIGVEKPGS